MKHIIDAEGKKLGRVASSVAALLIGKNSVTIQKNVAPNVTVEVINASKLDLGGKKRSETQYARYSGFPGGLRHENIDEIVRRKGYAGLFREAVYGMLPKNKLRPKMDKHLIVKE